MEAGSVTDTMRQIAPMTIDCLTYAAGNVTGC